MRMTSTSPLVDLGHVASPDGIRALRGDLSRAAFARRVGVTPHTVYRWELPAEAKDARRPRGAELAKLVALARGEEPDETSPRTARSPEPARSVESTVSAHEVSGTRVAHDDVNEVMPAFARVFESDWSRAHMDLLRVMTSPRALSDDALALAQTGTALVLALHRSDARGAFSTLAQALAKAEADVLSRYVSAKVFGAAAFVHAMTDGALFDIGRVHAYLARVESLARVEDDREALFLAWTGAIHAALLVGDQELVARAARGLDGCAYPGQPRLFQLIMEEVRGFCTYIEGTPHGLRRSLGELSREAKELGFSCLHARTLGTFAVKQLDALADPHAVLEMAVEARDAARSARLGPGIHTLFAIRGEADALLRMGRLDEAFRVLRELETWMEETGLPPTSATSVVARAYFITGREDALRDMARRFFQCAVVSMRPLASAYAAYCEAMAELVSARDPESTVAAFALAEAEASRWNLLLRDVLVFGAVAHVAYGKDTTQMRVELRKAHRFLERYPSPWAAAHLRRVEGTLAAVIGRPTEARRHLEAAAATFELANDRPSTLLTRHGALALSFVEGEERDLERALSESEAHLRSLGLVPPLSIRATIARSREALAEGKKAGRDASRLSVAIERLAVRGVAPELVRRVLVDAAKELTGHEVRLVTAEASPPPSDTEETSFELRDGAGGLLRLVVSASLDEGARSELAILTTTASLALELSQRATTGIETGVTPAEDEVADGPFVAASPVMRKLRDELGRLSASKATVIVTGESGTGKEVIAKTLVALSRRRDKPYVVFNCAAVPRDLFEGQLFGYRKGAFTGAVHDHAGVIRAADGGTLFLDEIGELPLDVQPKLLRFLENGEVLPLGGQKPVAVDVRIVTATHRDLGALVQAGTFREDLYYRLQVVPIHLPPLRERRDDVVPLALHFLREMSHGKRPPLLSSEARARLTGHAWPGNVRELRNVLDRTLAFEPVPEVLRAQDLRF